MTKKRLRILKVMLFATLGVPVLFITSLILRRPERVSDRLLRFGGRMINAATKKTDRIALVTGIAVLLLWIGIAAIACFERRKSSQKKTD